MAYNKVILTGRLVKDPEVNHTESGKVITKFTLAVDRPPTSKGAQKETDFIPCVAWDKTAEVIGNYTQKGSLILVEGRLQIRSYENKEGKKVYVTEVIVGKMEFLGSKGEAKQADAGFEDMGQSFSEDVPF